MGWLNRRPTFFSWHPARGECKLQATKAWAQVNAGYVYNDRLQSSSYTSPGTSKNSPICCTRHWLQDLQPPLTVVNKNPQLASILHVWHNTQCNQLGYPSSTASHPGINYCSRELRRVAPLWKMVSLSVSRLDQHAGTGLKSQQIITSKNLGILKGRPDPCDMFAPSPFILHTHVTILVKLSTLRWIQPMHSTPLLLLLNHQGALQLGYSLPIIRSHCTL